MTVNCKKFYNMNEVTNTLKILIDTGAGLSICQPKTCEKYLDKIK